MTQSLQPCGTYAAYQRHYRRGEEPCEACRQAYLLRNRTVVRRYRAKHGRAALAQQRAYDHALYALRDLYPDDFNRLYYIERALEGLPAVPGPRGGIGVRKRRSA